MFSLLSPTLCQYTDFRFLPKIPYVGKEKTVLTTKNSNEFIGLSVGVALGVVIGIIIKNIAMGIWNRYCSWYSNLS